LGGHVVVQPLPDLARPGRRVESGQFLLEFDAEHLASARVALGLRCHPRRAATHAHGINSSRMIARTDRVQRTRRRAPTYTRSDAFADAACGSIPRRSP